MAAVARQKLPVKADFARRRAGGGAAGGAVLCAVAAA